MSANPMPIDLVPASDGSVPTRPGDVLAGKYQVQEILGQGAMGVVVAAMHLQLHEKVALKFLLPAVAANREFNARFQREAQVTAKLRNEHVARVTDIGVLESGAPYMVMEYLQGEDLRKVLRDRGPFPIELAIDYVLQACEGVAEAHSLGIIHRDLKPSNLFLTKRRDGSDLVKVLDFGISKASLSLDQIDTELTSTGSVLGSPRYMSPEQLRSSTTVDSRADVWSIATILYELLTGRAPFQAESAPSVCAKILNADPVVPLREVRPDAPPDLERALARALEKDLSRRTPDVAAFATDLVGCTEATSAHMSSARVRGMITGALDALGPISATAVSGGGIPSPRTQSAPFGGIAITGLPSSNASGATSVSGSQPGVSAGSSSQSSSSSVSFATSSRGMVPVADGTAPSTSVSATGNVAAQPAGSSRGRLVGVASIAVLVAIIAFLLMRQQGGPPPVPAAALPAVTAAATPAPSPTPVAVAPTAPPAPVPVVSAAPIASADGADKTDSRSTKGGKVGSTARPGARPAATAGPAAATAAPPAPAKTSSPLEDRQ